MTYNFTLFFDGGSVGRHFVPHSSNSVREATVGGTHNLSPFSAIDASYSNNIFNPLYSSF